MDSTKEPATVEGLMTLVDAALHRMGQIADADVGYTPKMPKERAEIHAYAERLSARESAEGGEAKSETTPEEDAALLWLGTVRDDFRRMADEANRLLSHHAMNIAASPKAGESRTEEGLSLQLTIRQDQDSGWWIISGPPETGILIANPSLDLCVSDILPSWRALANLSPSQVPPVPDAPSPQVEQRQEGGE